MYDFSRLLKLPMVLLVGTLSLFDVSNSYVERNTYQRENVSEWHKAN